MEDRKRSLCGDNEELHYEAESSKFLQNVGSSIQTKENTEYQQNAFLDDSDFQKREIVCRRLPVTTENVIVEKIECAERPDVDDVSTNAEYYKDNKDVEVGELRNGCDKVYLDQKANTFILSKQLEHINLAQAFSDQIMKENVSEISSTNSKDSVSSITSAHPTNCTNTIDLCSNVINFEEPNTTNIRYCEKCKFDGEIKENCFDVRLCKASTALCVKSATEGKNTAQYITHNLSTETVNLSNFYSFTAPINNQKPLKYACQFPYITALPLHACNTFNHHNHCNHYHIHHHYNHSHQLESENYPNELHNASSSRLIFQLRNNSINCINSASKSQAKSQYPFFKYQSLDDNDRILFFQLPEIDKDKLQPSHHSNSDYSQAYGEYESQQSNLKDGSSTFTRNAEKVTVNEGLAIPRSLSLSSQKTGLALKTQSLDSRPIYPNVPYSPYSSPKSNRRRPPLRESKRISIEQSGSFLQLNQYKLLDQIGQGSYGLVKLAYSEEDSTHYAMKILSKRRLLRQAGLMKRGPKKSTSPLDRVYREIAVLKKLDHPNVVKLVEVLDDPVEDSLYMVFELVKQGEVLSVPTKNALSEERAWNVFRDTLLGLEYLHYQRIVHADIKPGNLLLTECGRVKIADLGLCNEFIGEDATMTNGSTAGTPAFRAPESLNVGQNIYCGKAADIWALGATLYSLVYGNVPFVASSIPVLYEKIRLEELYFPEFPKASFTLRDCIQCMLKKDPADRITLQQLKNHVWVNAGGLHPLPSEEQNCRLVQVNDEDINSVVRSIPKLDTLILIKTMLKKHSFGNPFSRDISSRTPQRVGSRSERFMRAGRSNSAPGSYNMIVEKQLSSDNVLPALCEIAPSDCTNEEAQ